MIKIMLVDDEPVFINDLRKAITRIGNDYEVICEAYDAQDAMKNIEINVPDIIFTDIKMPGINGICLVKEIKKHYSHIIPIILSGYQDFDLAREALRAEAEDYLLKPIDEDQLRIILNSKSEKAMFLRKKYQIEMLTCNLKANIISANYIATHFRSYSYYLLMITSSSITIQEDDLLEIPNYLSEKNENYWVINQALEEGTIIVFGLNHTSIKIIRSIGEKLVEKNGLNQNSVIISSPFYDIANLHNVFHKMKNEKDMIRTLGQSSVVMLEENNLSNNEEYFKILQKEYTIKLQNALWVHNWDSFCDILLHALEFCQTKKLHKALIKKFLGKITVYVEKNYTMLPEYTDLNIENYIERMVEDSNKFDILTSHYIKFLMKIFYIENHNHSISDKVLISLIELYLKENLTKKLNAKTVCRQFYISQPKMNRIIRKYKNMSFVEFFTFLKIEKAKIILEEEPELSISLLAFMLGFSDNLYFSKVFRRITYHTPTEYRKLHTLDLQGS